MSNDSNNRWALVEGIWSPIDQGIRYVGPISEEARYPYGIAVSPGTFKKGTITTSVLFEGEGTIDRAGSILFGLNAATRQYYSAGIGANGYNYVVSENIPNRGWVARAGQGSHENIDLNRYYQISFSLEGQRVVLSVDTIKVLDYTFPNPIAGDQIGLFAWGKQKTSFKDFEVEQESPRAFVIMEFSDILEPIYTDVIKPIAEENGLYVYRVDEVYRSGLILRDIVAGIVESEVIIAEITGNNPNVLYELGYAHAYKKETILLAQKGKKLPFDISGYRCIFYEDTIGGKQMVEDQLRKHLKSIFDS